MLLAEWFFFAFNSWWWHHNDNSNRTRCICNVWIPLEYKAWTFIWMEILIGIWFLMPTQPTTEIISGQSFECREYVINGIRQVHFYASNLATHSMYYCPVLCNRPQREDGNSVWNLRASIWLHFSICTLVILPSPVDPYIIFCCFYFCPILQPAVQKFLRIFFVWPFLFL